MANTDGNKIIGLGRGMSGARAEAAVEHYWTEERMRAAIPYPMRKVPAGAAPAAREPEKPGETGYTHHGFGEERNPEPQIELRGLGGQIVAASLSYPYRACGRIYFVQDETPYTASAAMVAPNVLLTAGHCVSWGVWSTNLAFYPSFPHHNVYDPAYKFNYNYMACWTAWKDHHNRAYDYAMVWFDTAPGNIIGWLGMLWNAPTANRTWQAVGYPGTPPPFSGTEMVECVGHAASSSIPGTFGLTNDNMEHGSSGGPWITNWKETVRTHANGLQSFHIHDGDTTEIGPYFTQDVKALLDWISNPANRH